MQEMGYMAPTLEVLSLEVEQGFVGSDLYGDEGDAGKGGFINDYDEF